MIKVDQHVRIEATEIEFHQGQNTIWVHSPLGGTVLRIKCTGKINIHPNCTNNLPHADMQVQGDIDVCMPASFAGFGWRILEEGTPLKKGDGVLHPHYGQWLDYDCRPDLFRGEGNEVAHKWPWRRRRKTK